MAVFLDGNGVRGPHFSGAAALIRGALRGSEEIRRDGGIMVEAGLMVTCGEGSVPPVYERRDDRGTFHEIVNRGPWESVITAQMRQGAVLGHHYHKETRIFLHLARGAARVSTVNIRSGERRCIELSSGRGLFLEPLWAHAIGFLSDSELIILKSRAYREDDPDTYCYPVEGESKDSEACTAGVESPGKATQHLSRA